MNIYIVEAFSKLRFSGNPAGVCILEKEIDEKLMLNVQRVVLFTLLLTGILFGQNNQFEKIEFLLGSWSGNGVGFGNEKSVIHSEFKSIMHGTYIEFINDSKFTPTEKNPGGDHHIDKGIISFDKIRELIVLRQFNIEGYVNQYILNDSLSSDSTFVFETEIIENFTPGGKGKWVIEKISENEIKTTIEVSFPRKDYTCLGTNYLKKEE